MKTIYKALGLAAIMIGMAIASVFDLISQNAAQMAFITIPGMSAVIIANDRRGCAPCSLFNRERKA